MSNLPGLVEALEPVAKIFEAMKINFYVGDSVASSFHGAAQLSPLAFLGNYSLRET